MPRRRPQQKLLPNHIRKNKRQAFLPQSVGYGDDHAIFEISASTSSTASLLIVQTGDGDLLRLEDDSQTGDSTPFVVDSQGNLIIGWGNVIPSQGGQTPRISTHSTAESNEFALGNWASSSTNHARIMFLRSSGGTLSGYSAVSAGFILGEIGFAGVDYSQTFRMASSIKGEVFTASGSVVQGQLGFYVGRATGGQHKAMTIEPDGQVSISGSLNVIGTVKVNGNTVQHVVDEVVFTYVNTNPGTLFGYGTWSSLGSGSLFSAVVYSWVRTA